MSDYVRKEAKTGIWLTSDEASSSSGELGELKEAKVGT